MNARVQTIEAPLAVLEHLGYQARDREVVVRFLDDYPIVIELLEEAFPFLQRYFEAHPPVMLDVIHDADGNDSRELFALIRTGVSPEIAVEQQFRFVDEWWSERAGRAGGRLNFDLEFT